MKVYHRHSGKNDHSTPQGVFDFYNKQYNYKLDAAASKKTAKCKKFITEKEDALKIDWKKKAPICSHIFINPPFDLTYEFLEKAVEQIKKHSYRVSFLIPARTDTEAWHKFVGPHLEAIRFIKGRLCYDGMPADAGFPSVLVILGPKTYTVPRIYFDDLSPEVRGFKRKQKEKSMARKVKKSAVKKTKKVMVKKVAPTKPKSKMPMKDPDMKMY